MHVVRLQLRIYEPYDSGIVQIYRKKAVYVFFPSFSISLFFYCFFISFFLSVCHNVFISFVLPLYLSVSVLFSSFSNNAFNILTLFKKRAENNKYITLYNHIHEVQTEMNWNGCRRKRSDHIIYYCHSISFQILTGTRTP